MHTLRTLLIGLIVGTSTSLEAGPILIPSDLAVSLSAEPNADLHSGDIVSFTISITNNGPEPVDRFALGSSPIYDELDVLSGTADCDYHLLLAVVDLDDGFYYTYTWAVLLPGDPPMQVGETRYCYFSLPYTPWAPPEFPLTFSSDPFIDLDPSNNSATVTLRRAVQGAATTPVPTLSHMALATLIALMALSGAWPILADERRHLPLVHNKPTTPPNKASSLRVSAIRRVAFYSLAGGREKPTVGSAGRQVPEATAESELQRRCPNRE